MNWSLVIYIGLGIIVLASGGMIAVMYVRKFPKVAALDLDAMSEHRQSMRKRSLVEERLLRKLAQFRTGLKKLWEPIWSGVRGIGHWLFGRLKNLEEKYKRAAEGGVSGSAKAQTQQQSLEMLLQEATVLIDEEKYAKAEQKYIKAIGIDKTSVEAYQGLADVYTMQRDWDHALETLEFLLQLHPNDEGVLRTIADLYERQDKYDKALEAYERAVEMNPKNPKNLDAVVKLSIKNKLKYKAEGALTELEKVNPENQKLGEYREQIAQL